VTTSTAVERRAPAPITYNDIMKAPELKALTSDQALAIIKPRLSPGITVERVLSEVIGAVQTNPELGECTPTSLVAAVAKATSTGLVIGEKIHLVPFNVNAGTRDKPVWEKRAQAIRDYKGDIELVIRAGGARLIDAQCFYEKEPFTFRLGTEPKIEHQPLSPGARGKMVGAYAVAKVGAYDSRSVMYVDEIDAIRQKFSKQWKGGDLPAWYAKKTVVHQIVKQLPSTPGLNKIRSGDGPRSPRGCRHRCGGRGCTRQGGIERDVDGAGARLRLGVDGRVPVP
jgi:phage RecT family recombinase